MKTIAIIAAAFAAFHAVPSQAGETRAAETVRTADLDLSSRAGQRALELRIVHAASALCGTPSSADPRGKRNAEDCRAEARASAEAQSARLIARAQGADAVALRAQPLNP